MSDRKFKSMNFDLISQVNEVGKQLNQLFEGKATSSPRLDLPLVWGPNNDQLLLVISAVTLDKEQQQAKKMTEEASKAAFKSFLKMVEEETGLKFEPPTPEAPIDPWKEEL